MDSDNNSIHRPKRSDRLGTALSMIAALWLSAGLLGCASGTGPRPVDSKHGHRQHPDEVGNWANTFRQLRQRRGHFAGGAWQADIDQWQGIKHRTMQQLAAYADRQQLNLEQLTALLGPPDALLVEMPAHLSRLFAGLAVDELVAYHWRGKHDVLYLALTDNQVVAARWWYAYE